METTGRRQSEPDASFHDIGKIVNWDQIGLRRTGLDGKPEEDPHEFQKCIEEDWNSPDWGIDPSAAPWQSILTWQRTWPAQYRKSMARWHAKTADWLASGYGRPLSEEGKRQLKAVPAHAVYCLWTGKQRTDLRLRTDDELRKLISLLNTSPSWEEAIQKYRSQLRVRPEDERPGFDVTSLLVHSATAGKLARVLAKANWPKVDPSANPTQKAARGLGDTPRLMVCHFRLGFRQRVFRARDLGVFRQMKGALTEVIEQFPDNVLSRFGLECVSAFQSEESRREFLKRLEDAGFTVEERAIDKSVAEYLAKPSAEPEEAPTRGLMTVLDEPWRPAYTEEPPERIDLPICEGCQMAQATRHWPEGYRRDEELGEEDLCEQCFQIRRNTPGVRLLKDWEGDVLYARISLDLDRLAGHDRQRGDKKQDSALEFLHKQYLASLYPGIEKALLDQLFVSFPMVVDFVGDYQAFLEETWDAMEARFPGRTARLDSTLCCMGMEKMSESLEALGIIHDCFGRAFPKLLAVPKEIENPIGIAVSISNKKHPFFDHWRFLEKPKPNMSVQVVGSGRAMFHLFDLQRIIPALRESKRSQLHRLAAAASVSEALGRVVLREQDNRGIVLRELSELVPDALDFESARILANLTED